MDGVSRPNKKLAKLLATDVLQQPEMETELAHRLEDANFTRRRPVYGWQSIDMKDSVKKLLTDINLTEASVDTSELTKNLATLKEQNNRAYKELKEVLKQLYAKDR